MIREIYSVGLVASLNKRSVDFPRDYQLRLVTDSVTESASTEQAILLAKVGAGSEIATGGNTCAARCIAAHHTVQCVTCVVPDPS